VNQNRFVEKIKEIESVPAYLWRCVRRDWCFLLIVFLLMAATVVWAMTGGRVRRPLNNEPSSMEMSLK
jgi:hypothetical protein